MSLRLAEQIHDRLARRDRPADAAVVLRGVQRDAEGVVDGCGELFGADGMAFDGGAVLVAFAIDRAALDAAAGEDCGETLRPVLPAGRILREDVRRAAELAHADDK